MEEHRPIELPELLQMNGTASVCTRLALQMRREAEDLLKRVHHLIADAEELEDAARQCHEFKEAEDNDT